jgi:hypothetical protein
MKKVLDSIIEAALQEALAALAARAKDMVFEAAQAALEARVRALLEEGGLTPAQEAPARAKAKAQGPTTPEPLESQEAPVKPRKRVKAQVAQVQEDLGTILEGVKVALAKYAGVTTPRGKELPDVLLRRIRKVLEHAATLGRTDLATLARSALAHIASDPRGVAMGSWQALAAKLGLPVPVAQGE